MLQVHPKCKLTKRHTLKSALKARGRNGYVQTTLAFITWRVRYQLWLWSLKQKVSGRWTVNENDSVAYVAYLSGSILNPPGARTVIKNGQFVLTLGNKPWYKRSDL